MVWFLFSLSMGTVSRNRKVERTEDGKLTILCGLRPMTTRGRKMTYKIDPSIEKIKSPVVLVIGEDRREFEDGAAACRSVFDRKWKVAEIAAIESKIEISLEESDEPDQSFF